MKAVQEVRPCLSPPSPTRACSFGQQARDAGIAVSMGSRGDCFDNAVAESFFATIKKELIRRRSWPERRELIGEVFDYIETFDNQTRRHSTPGYLSPRQLEEQSINISINSTIT